jgi:hypothetical protein
MKALVTVVMMAFASMAFAAEPAKTEQPKKDQPNCVTKDKKGNCPAAPNSPKPTPKKPAEAK